MLSKKAPFWKKKDRGNLPIEASAMEANASGKAPAPMSQSAQQPKPATPAPAPQPAQQPKPATPAPAPKPAQQPKPATPAPAPKPAQQPTSEGEAMPGFEFEKAKTDICNAITKRIDELKAEMAGRLDEQDKKWASHEDRFSTLEDKVKKIEEQLAQQPASVPTSKLVSTTSASALSAAGRVPDGDGVGYYFLNSNEGKWQYTWNVNVADQLSNGQWQKCYVSWKKGAFSGWLDEAAIKKLLGGSPRDGIHKTYVYWVPDDRDQRYHWDQAAAYQLSGSYAASELLYTIEYWWWKDGAPERQLTKEEFERNHLG